MKTPTQIIDEIDRRVGDKRDAMRDVRSDRYGNAVQKMRAISLLQAELAELLSLREFVMLQ